MNADLRCYNIADLRQRARRRLPLGIWEYAERGVEDECGMARNRAAFDEITFRPRVLRGVEAARLVSIQAIQPLRNIGRIVFGEKLGNGGRVELAPADAETPCERIGSGEQLVRERNGCLHTLIIPLLYRHAKIEAEGASLREAPFAI